MKYPRKVYAIRHNATDRVYIGSSCNVDKRFAEHISALRSHRHPVEDMQEDFDRYGEDYTFTILDRIATEAERNKEYDWMNKHQSYMRGIGYNYNDRKWLALDKGEEEPILICKENKSAIIPRTENEKELINIIRNHEDPAQAIMIAFSILTCFVKANEQNKKNAKD